MRWVALAASLMVALTLSGCKDNNKMADLKKFVDEAKAFKTSAKSQLPTLKLNESVRYVSSNLKNPFVPLKQDARKKIRPTDPLQNYPLESLHLVGVLAKHDKYWAAIKLPNGHVLEVGVGAQVGQNHAKITSITHDNVVLNEPIETQSGKRVKEIRMSITNGN